MSMLIWGKNWLVLVSLPSRERGLKLVPDDGLEDYIRQVGHLPERTSDTREIDRKRQDQQEQDQPPEPETAAGTRAGEDVEEIPDGKAKAAKRRLGRECGAWDSG